MASRDLHNHLGVLMALAAVAINADKTTTGVIIDTDGFEGVEFAIHSATITDGSYAPQITEGDAADLSDGVVATDLIGTVADATFAAADDNTVKKLGYYGSKRYVRLDLVSTGVTTGGTLGAVAALGYARNQPVA